MNNHKINVIIFASILAFGLGATIFTPDKEFSEMENRTLAQRPDFSLKTLFAGTLDEDTENYLADQFIFRDMAVEIKSITDKLLGKQEFNGSFYEDGRLLEKIPEPDSDLLNKNIIAVSNAANALDIPLSLALVPTASDIYSDTLPYGAPTADQHKLIQSIYNGIGYANAIDMDSIMHENKDEYIFYRTDHHWTSLGAYYGAKEILSSLGIEIAPLESFNPQTVSDEFYGTLYSSSGIRDVEPDSIDIYVPEDSAEVESWRNGAPEQSSLYDLSFLDKKDKYSMFLGGNQPLAIIRTGNEGEKLMLVRDSYADSLVPFLIPYFSEIHLFDARYFKQPLSTYVTANEIDRAIMLFSVKNFITDTNLQMVCN